MDVQYGWRPHPRPQLLPEVALVKQPAVFPPIERNCHGGLSETQVDGVDVISATRSA